MKLTVGNRILNAEFKLRVLDEPNLLEIILESRGPNRNIDYTECLKVLLRALCDAEAEISSIEVVSQRTMDLDVSGRQLAFKYPIQLDPTTDFAKLTNRIGDLQRKVRSGAKTSGGGNRTRRLRLLCSTTRMTNAKLMELLCEGTSAIRQRAFVMLWNPAHWRIEDYLAELDKFQQGSLGRWSTGARQSGIFNGDMVLLLQVGREGKGIIGCGITSAPNVRGVECVFRDGHWSRRNVDANYVNVKWSDLVHPDDKLAIDRFVDEFPDVSWGHLQGSGTQVPSVVGKTLTKQFQEYVGGASLESPEVADARAAIDSLAGRKRGGSARRHGSSRAARLTAQQRRSIELRAMKVARTHLRKQGWTKIVDTSAGNPFDFYCKRGSSEIWVEVKGTTSNGSSVVLTRNEVRHHRSVHPRNSLIIVHSIRLTGPQKIRATEGVLHEICPWRIQEVDLDPIGFDYTTGL